jgi:hypothetical protein
MHLGVDRIVGRRVATHMCVLSVVWSGCVSGVLVEAVLTHMPPPVLCLLYGVVLQSGLAAACSKHHALCLVQLAA